MKLLIIAVTIAALGFAQEKPAVSTPEKPVMWDLESMGKAIGQPTHYSLIDHVVVLSARVKALEMLVTALEKRIQELSWLPAGTAQDNFKYYPPGIYATQNNTRKTK